MDSPHDQSREEMEIIKVDNALSQMASKDEWNEVVNIYRNIPEAHKAIINRSGDTALHRAVSDGKEEIVEQLIAEIISPGGGGKVALEIKNNQGDTPLHVAVSKGNVRMCKCIAQAYPSLVGVGNLNRETPIFLAALHDKKDIFLRLLKVVEGDDTPGKDGKEGKEEKDGKDIAKESMISNILFHMTRKEKWDKVVNIYEWTTLAHTAKITSSGDTALHTAVSEDNKERVEELIKEISANGEEGNEALKVKNERGNTALHVAASMGSVGMCQCIAQVDISLVGVRNGDGETPFFLAALHGRKEAFLCLLRVCRSGSKDIFEDYSRRNDGDTILHVAVAGDYFDLAYQIIQLYPELVNSVNEEGFTPLHLLAGNPSNFKSGSNLGLYSQIIYHCIFVDQLQVDPKIKQNNDPKGDSSTDQQPEDEEYLIPKCLKNIFKTWISTILSFLKADPTVNMNGKNGAQKHGDHLESNDGEQADQGGKYDLHQPSHAIDVKTDTRSQVTNGARARQLFPPNYFGTCFNLNNKGKNGAQTDGDLESNTGSQVTNGAQARQLFPPNYVTCFEFLKLSYKAALVIFGLANNKGKNGNQANRGLESNSGSQVTNQARAHQLFPPNYITCFEFLNLSYKAVLVIFGLGPARIKRIADMKEKHTWSVQIMKELVKSASSYEYGNTGTSPSSYSTLQPDQLNGPPSTSEGSEGEDKKEDLEGKDEPAGNETSVLVAAKNGVSEIAKNIQEYFPVAIQDKNPKNKKIIRLTMQNRQQLELGKGISKVVVVDAPILIAAKNGITEIVEKILEDFPFAIHDVNIEKKNMVLLAVEHRQPHIYLFLLKRKNRKDSEFQVVDNEGNSALHLAANLGGYKPWLIPGAALQMQWEIKWYEFVKESMPPHFFPRYNKQRKTPEDLFTETHRDLVKEGGEWLSKTSESCSVVAALIATVAFATSSTVPGGVKQESGTPILVRHPAFSTSAISSVIALCFSVTAVIMFLAILTSRYQERDFRTNLPRRLLLGLKSLFLSIASVLISFCAGDYFVLKDNMREAVFPVYAVMCLPVTFYALAQLPLYLDLIQAAFEKVPQRSNKAALL